jgi:ParB/RepB/Spo0J family partition protein
VSTTHAITATAVQLRTVPVSAIAPIEGWNPRRGVDDAELRALSASMLERGCLVPIRVQATGNGAYRLVDGEKRYKAAGLASLMELPAIVRPVDSDADAVVAEGELLVDAVVANQLRSQLSPVEEALACRRLKSDHGLTLKGIAQKLQMTQARVRERLSILELPEALWPRICSGEIPLSSIGGLVGLAKIHPGLAEIAVTLVLDCEGVYDADPWRWQDVASDALAVVAGGLHDETVDAPTGVFVSTRRYRLSAFGLDEKHQAAAAKLAELRGTTVDERELRFDRDAIEQARKLNAAYASEHGWVTLIVGQDVADTIVADQVDAALKAARADAKRARDTACQDAAGDTGEDGTNPMGATAEAVDEEAQKEQARAERAAAAAERERCAAFNDELGVAIVNSLSCVKVDDRTVKILTAANVAGELDRIAMRGARYGFPGWVNVEETKRATKRRYIEQRSDAEAKAKAIEYLEGAKTAGELADHTLALLVMAVYAQEGAVAQSARAFHSVAVHSALPWAGDVPELIDELAAEKLPATLMDPILSERLARHEQRRAAAAAKAEAEARVDELQARIEDLAIDELDELERLADVAYGEFTVAARRLRDAVRARRTALVDAHSDDAGQPAADRYDRAGDEDQQTDADADTGDEHDEHESA